MLITRRSQRKLKTAIQFQTHQKTASYSLFQACRGMTRKWEMTSRGGRPGWEESRQEVLNRKCCLARSGLQDEVWSTNGNDRQILCDSRKLCRDRSAKEPVICCTQIENRIG